MRVLHVTESLGEAFGGLSKTILDISSEMTRQGHEAGVISSDELVPPPIKSPSYLRKVIQRFRTSRRLSRRIAESVSSSDVVHVHGLWRMHNIYAARSAAKAGVPLVVSTHGMLSPDALRISAQAKRLAWWVFQRGLLKSAAAIHVTSVQEQLDVTRKRVGPKVFMIPHGLDFSELEQHRGARKNVILFLGRIHPIKNLELLVDAWGDLSGAAVAEGWELWIVGSGEPEYVTGLRARAKAKCQNVKFMGSISSPKKELILATASVLILPSASENFGLVVLEALAQATPVICSTGTPWQQVVDQGCGLWVEPTQYCLGAAMSWFLSQPADARCSMGRSGQVWVRNDFNLNSTVGDILALYSDVTKCRKSLK